MSLTARAQASAERLIAHFGARPTGQLTATITPKGTYTVATGAVGAAGTTLTVNVSQPTPYRAELVDGANVLARDLQTFVASSDPGLTSAPEVGDVVVLDSETYDIRDVVTHPGAYELQLRGA